LAYFYTRVTNEMRRAHGKMA